MPLQRSNTADKFIVDRRKRHRNSDVARAVRKTRDRLSQQAGNPGESSVVRSACGSVVDGR